MDDLEITAPGDETNQRLLMGATAGEGSVMKLEDGTGTATLWLELDVRTLVSVDERETVCIIMVREQAAYIVKQLLDLLSGE